MSDYSETETVQTVRVTGRVKWFDAVKGYGFIVPDDPTLTETRDVLLHISSLRDLGRDAADEGATIMVLGGEPIGERFMLWNFVSSSKDRLQQAKEDWIQGRMKLPDADNQEFTPFPEERKVS